MGGTAKMGGTATLGGGGISSGTWTTNTDSCAAQSGSGSGVTTESCTWSVAPTSGMSVFCSVVQFSASVLTFTVTDSNSDSYTAVGSQVTQGGGTDNVQQVFWFPKLTNTITTSTFNLSGAGGGYPSITCNAATDSGASPAIDGSQCSGSNVSSWTSACSSALTPTATDYVFGASAVASGTQTSGSGFTLGAASATYIANEYGLFSTTVTPSMGGNSSQGSFIGVAFKP